MFYYSKQVGNDGEMLSCNLLSKKQYRTVTDKKFVLTKHIKGQARARGIEHERKQTLMKIVLPLISSEDRKYWENLPESTN